jgi:hypothetical protein
VGSISHGQGFANPVKAYNGVALHKLGEDCLSPIALWSATKLLERDSQLVTAGGNDPLRLLQAMMPDLGSSVTVLPTPGPGVVFLASKPSILSRNACDPKSQPRRKALWMASSGLASSLGNDRPANEVFFQTLFLHLWTMTSISAKARRTSRKQIDNFRAVLSLGGVTGQRS